MNLEQNNLVYPRWIQFQSNSRTKNSTGRSLASATYLLDSSSRTKISSLTSDLRLPHPMWISFLNSDRIYHLLLRMSSKTRKKTEKELWKSLQNFPWSLPSGWWSIRSALASSFQIHRPPCALVLVHTREFQPCKPWNSRGGAWLLLVMAAATGDGAIPNQSSSTMKSSSSSSSISSSLLSSWIRRIKAAVDLALAAVMSVESMDTWLGGGSRHGIWGMKAFIFDAFTLTKWWSYLIRYLNPGRQELLRLIKKICCDRGCGHNILEVVHSKSAFSLCTTSKKMAGTTSDTTSDDTTINCCIFV